MEIKIPGTGCTRCHQLEQVVKAEIKELGQDVSIENISDIKKIMEYSILATPGMVINEELVLAEQVPSKAEVTNIITTALAKKEN